MATGKWLHNLSGETKNYGHGDILDDAFWEVPSRAVLERLIGLDSLFSDVSSGDIVCSADGVSQLSGNSAKQWNFLIQIIPIDEGGNIPIVNNKGTGDFETVISHDFTDPSEWPATDDSKYEIAPTSGNVYRLEKAEVQFSHDIQMDGITELYFDVWAYNPLVDLGATIDADDPTFVPGVSSGNPLYFLVERQTYKSIRDVLNKGNEHFTMPAIDGMVHGMTTVQFNYPKWIELKASQGARIRVCTKDHDPLSGDFCTVSFLISKATE